VVSDKAISEVDSKLEKTRTFIIIFKKTTTIHRTITIRKCIVRWNTITKILDK